MFKKITLLLKLSLFIIALTLFLSAAAVKVFVVVLLVVARHVVGRDGPAGLLYDNQCYFVQKLIFKDLF
jgi:hypothetical protein